MKNSVLLIVALMMLLGTIAVAQAAPASLYVIFSVQQFVGFEGRYSLSSNAVLFGNVGLQGLAGGLRLFSTNVKGLFGGAGVVMKYNQDANFAIFAGWYWALKELANAEFFMEGEIKIKIKDGKTSPDLDIGLSFKF